MVLRCSFTLGLVGGACTTLTKISPDVSLKVTKRSRAGQYATQVHRKAGIYPAIFFWSEIKKSLKEKVLISLSNLWAVVDWVGVDGKICSVGLGDVFWGDYLTWLTLN